MEGPAAVFMFICFLCTVSHIKGAPASSATCDLAAAFLCVAPTDFTNGTQMCSYTRCSQKALKGCSEDYLKEQLGGMVTHQQMDTAIAAYCSANENCKPLSLAQCPQPSGGIPTQEEQCSLVECMYLGLKDCDEGTVKAATGGLLTLGMLRSEYKKC